MTDQNQQDLELKKELEKIDWKKYLEYGSVRIAKLADQKKYITVKIPHDSLDITNVKINVSGESLDRFSSKLIRNSDNYGPSIVREFNINKQLTIKLNGGDPNRIIKRGDVLMVPTFSIHCLIDHDVVLETITIPKGSYLCMNEIYSEFLIGLLCSNLARTKSINFLDVMDLSMCPESKSEAMLKDKSDDGSRSSRDGSASVSDTSYMFQELMTGTINDGLISLNDSILIQVFHAIACYQENYAISHNDLHAGNILYKKYEGLEETTHLAFILDDIVLYIPKPKYIIKIADFGRSCKYSDYMILNHDVVNAEYPIPATYSTFYDLGTIIMSILEKTQTPLLLKCITYLLKGNVGPESKYINFLSDDPHPLDRYFDKYHTRPLVKILDEPPLSDMSSYKLLKSHVFRKFRDRPIGNIVVVSII